MNEKFTPGPWEAGKNPYMCDLVEDYGKSIYVGNDSIAWAKVKNPNSKKAIQKAIANAALIAAAPEMYEMLQFFCSRKHTPICKNAPDSCSVCKLNRILKKARGEE